MEIELLAGYFKGSDRDKYQALHRSAWSSEVAVSQQFSLFKRQLALEALTPVPESADIVFYDAFGPRFQPELWSPEAMETMHLILVPGGILVTYCAQGQFRRNLRACGFQVESLQGPPGKREMTRARKT